MTNLQEDIFQAHCQVDDLQNHFEEGGTVRHTHDDIVTMDLWDGSYTEISLRPIQHLLTVLRGMT